MGAEEWREVTVEDLKAPIENALATGPFGSSISSRYFQERGVPVLRGSNLSENVGTRLIDDGFVFVSEEKAVEFKRSIVRRGDLVFTCWGTINQVGLIDNRTKYSEYIISNKQMKFTPDPEKADSLFLYYLFSGPKMQDTMKNQRIGSSVPGFNLGQLRTMLLKVPRPDEQRAIAQVLGTLDDKIEINRRTNETLEAIARAIFKSWFVDFDPVRKRADDRDPYLPKAIADLFPDRFEKTVIEDIPAQWEVGTLGDIAALVKEPINPLDNPSGEFLHLSIPAFDEGQQPKQEAGAAIKSLKFRVPDNVVLLAKLNPEIERVWLVDVGTLDRAVCSTEFLVLRPKPPFSRFYLYCLARSPGFRSEIEGLVTGTSKSHQRAQADAVLDLVAPLPQPKIVKAFESVVAPLLERTLANKREMRTLAALRDTLLPKLVSGELRVKDP